METVIMGVSSGIAGFKIIPLVKALKKRYKVICMLTEHAEQMFGRDFKKAKISYLTDLIPKNFRYENVLKKRKVRHIELADSASLIILAPATANIIAKLANGIADDLLTTTILASRAPLIICPSMNVHMWNNRTTQENIEKLKRKGMFLIMPEKGSLACGYTGTGRLTDIRSIEHEAEKIVGKSTQMKGKNVLVTAGGTEEAIDEVRVLTNRSSGRMGIAIAEECAKRGAEVTLIKARTEVEPAIYMEEMRVRSSDDLFEAMRKNIKKADYLIHAAAVSDFIPRKRKGKISSGKRVSLMLEPNEKIIGKIRALNEDVVLVGFKTEKRNLKNEMRFLAEKTDAYLVVGNPIKSIGSETTEITLFKNGKFSEFPMLGKNIAAERIVDEL